MASRGGTSKEQLRRAMKERLARVEPSTAARSSQRLTERLWQLPELAAARRVFLCLSFGTEIDLDPLVDRLLREGRELYVPRVDRGSDLLRVHPYPCDLETLSFGLRQPAVGTQELPASAIDDMLEVALVAGLAFDRRGFRLGYGRGYFDRFLAGRRFPTVGVGYHFQLVPRLPAEAHDVALGMVVTDRAVLRVARESAG